MDRSRVIKFLGSAEAPPFWDSGCVWPSRNATLPTRVTTLNLVALRQTMGAYAQKSAGKFGPIASRLSRSLDVIGTDTDRTGSCDFILVIRINCRPVSYRFGDKLRLLSRIANFPIIPLRGQLLKFCNKGGTAKTRVLVLPEGQNV